MAASGGYDLKCVEATANNDEWSICNFILRKPVQMACGHRFCRDCLNACFDKYVLKFFQKTSLRKKCPYSELFWSAFFSAFSCIRTEYSISPYSVRMPENTGKMRTRITPNTDIFYAVLYAE